MTTIPQNPTAAPAAPRPAPGGATGAAPNLLGATIDPVRLFKQYYRWLIVAGLVGIILGVGVFFPLRRYAPQFRATTYFRITPVIDSPVASPTQTLGGRGGEAEMSMFMYSQVQDMLSERVLSTAAARGGDIERQAPQWSRKFRSGSDGAYDATSAALALRDVVTARVLPDTQYISLSARYRDRVEATVIANGVAQAYIRQLNARTRADFLEQEESINQQLRRMRDEKQRLDQRAARLLGDNKIESIDYRQSEAQTQINTLTPQLGAVQAQLEVTRDRLRTYETSLTAPGGATYPEYLREEVQRDPVITRHNQDLAALRTSLRTMLEDLGPQHLEIRRIESRIRAVEIERASDEQRLLSDRFSALIDGTRQQIRSYEAQQRDLQEQINGALLRANELTMLLDEFRNIRAESDRYAAQIADLVRSQEDLRAITERRVANRVAEVIPATIPDSPVFPRLILIVPLVTFFVVGLVTGLILLRELLEQRVRAPADVAMIPRTRLLGVIPDISEDPSRPVDIEHVLRDKPDGVISEQIRQLRTNILKRIDGRGPCAVLVTSGLPGSGTTSILANLARSCAALDQRVLYIDANMRRPNASAVFGLSESPGLGEVLAGGTTLDKAVQRTDLDTLHLLAAGAQSTRIYERLNSAAMTSLIEEAKRSYALVLIDSPPMAVAGDALVLASRVDATALVVRTLAETRGLIARVHAQLSDTKSELLGVIVNGVKSSSGGYFRKNYKLTHEYHDQSRRNLQRL
ncbi:MAG: polysaccharide biosynthesis tyrosine autokinase [Phycisphaerales bacterium]|nr:MAG: polysaccharide biosynthesis tyrosine autokinase [Phycisphaerales bacterium]